VGQIWHGQLTQAMIKGQFKGVCCAIAKGPMADGRGFVVECFHSTIVDWNLEIAEDVFLMAANHPADVPEPKSRICLN